MKTICVVPRDECLPREEAGCSNDLNLPCDEAVCAYNMNTGFLLADCVSSICQTLHGGIDDLRSAQFSWS